MDGSAAKHHKKYFKKITLLLVISLIATGILSGAVFARKKSNDTAYATGCASAVMEVTSLRLLGGSNENIRLPMASTTKVMTALVAIESADVNGIVTVPKAAVGIEGSSIYLTEGEKLSLKELLFGLMLRSGNDAAVAIAVHVGGSIENFAKMMNEKASSLGLSNTNFTNPHGLHDEKHYTTAYDLAVISSVAMCNPIFKEIVGTKMAVISGPDNTQRYLANKNKFLSNYQGATGVKTGYTKAAGRCLVAGSKRGNMELVSVVLNVPPMYEECGKLMDTAYSTYEMCRILEKGKVVSEIPVKNGKSDEVSLCVLEDVYYPLKSGEREKLSMTVNLIEQAMVAPVNKMKKCGEVKISIEERLLFCENLYTINSVEKKTVKDKIKDFFSK